MRSFYFFILCICSVCAAMSCYSNKANNIVQKAISAHGGDKGALESIEEISLEKEIWIFNNVGDTISHKVEMLNFKPNESLSGEISWNEGQDEHVISFFEGSVVKKINDSLLISKKDKDKALHSYLSASFTLFQPFYLTDKNIQLIYKGIDTLPGEQIVHEILAVFPENDAGNKESWTYFFDLENFRMVGMMVFYNESYSLILNESYREKAGVLWHGIRHSYKVDTNRQVEYLRASYDYKNYVVK